MFALDLLPAEYRTPAKLAEYLQSTAESPDDIERLVNLLATTKRQSGMESNHEKWIMAILNFLNGHDIPFYKRDERGNKKGEYAIPERLSLLTEKLATAMSNSEKAVEKANDAHVRAGKYQNIIAALEEEFEGKVVSQRVIDLFEAAKTIDGFWSKSMTVSLPDERGITRHRIDARAVVLRLGLSIVTHDLEPNQKICPECLGLGILKCDQSYGLGERKPREDAFPYHHQWLAPCHTCVMGKVTLCEHCKNLLPRFKLECDCAGARSARSERRRNEEIAKVAGFPRVKIADYTGEMVAVGDAAGSGEKFISTDEISDYLVRHPDALFFACEKTDSLFEFSAGDIMERMQEDATSNANPVDDEDVLEFSADAQAELNSLLEAWIKKHVTARSLWYPIDVVVVPKEIAPTEQPTT
jgi:hypothetical protein